jgi:hypothetical protein
MCSVLLGKYWYLDARLSLLRGAGRPKMCSRLLHALAGCGQMQKGRCGNHLQISVQVTVSSLLVVILDMCLLARAALLDR